MVFAVCIGHGGKAVGCLMALSIDPHPAPISFPLESMQANLKTVKTGKDPEDAHLQVNLRGLKMLK